MVNYIKQKDEKIEDLKEKGVDSIKLSSTYLDLSSYFEQIDDFKEALFYYKKYHALAIELKKNEAKIEINKLKEAQNESEYISTHDSLTGLYNRAYFENENAILNIYGFENLGIIFCDIDCLKIINDTFGHSEGDNLIICVSNILKKCISKEDKLIRIGGDEFLIMILNTTKNHLDKSRKKIIEIIDSTTLGEKRLPISISLGCAIGNSNEISLNELIKIADKDMYNQKIIRREEVEYKLMYKISKSRI